ncbi:DoxX family protein [Streptomyces scopuliridis]|uniref:DoxX family protein n=2 Tax=Streptomyces scopuliridis TaxID=452529 RepID=A0A2T7T570_9ACTN|nr:DoxX family protein [Streptomyces scopuliridis]PVE10284.1 DoxX family protein [Streptomyces scopuliridis RB72]
MNVALWIVAGVLAFLFAAVGLMKISKPKAELVAGNMPWAGDFSSGAVKAIGAVEVLGAIGLVLPAVLDIAVVLVPLAATGLAVTMAGAAVVHARRKENPAIGVNIVLLALAVFVVWGRFGSHSF